MRQTLIDVARRLGRRRHNGTCAELKYATSDAPMATPPRGMPRASPTSPIWISVDCILRFGLCQVVASLRPAA